MSICQLRYVLSNNIFIIYIFFKKKYSSTYANSINPDQTGVCRSMPELPLSTIFGLSFYPKRFDMYRSCLTLRTYACQFKQATSHSDVTFLAYITLICTRDVSPTAAGSGFLKSQTSSYSFISMTL